MDLNVISSWNSVGKDLYNVEKLSQELIHLRQHNRELEKRNNELTEQWNDKVKEDRRVEYLTETAQKRLLLCYYMMRRWTKGFAVGYGCRLAFGLIPIVLKLSNGRLKGNKELLDRLKSLFIGMPLNAGLCLGTILSTFEALMRVTREFTTLSRQHRTIVSALVSGFSILFLPSSSRSFWSLFIWIRAFEVFAHYLVRYGWVPSIPHMDVVLMMLASAQNLWGWVHGPQYVDLEYVRFLNVHGGQPTPIIRLFDLFNRQTAPEVMEKSMAVIAINEKHTAMGIAPLNCQSPNMFCTARHPKRSSCLMHFFDFLPQGILRAISVYLPVYGVTTFLFRWSKLTKSPISTLINFSRNLAQSSFFLGSYCAMSWLACCMYSKVFTPHWICAPLAGLAGGSTVILERKSRRIELALYVASHGLKTFYRLWRDRGWIPAIPQVVGELFMFCTAMAMIMHAYVNNPHMMRKSYFGLFKFFFGSANRSAGLEQSRTRTITSDKKPASSRIDRDERCTSEDCITPRN